MSPFSSSPLAKFGEWHWRQLLNMRSRSFCQSSWVVRKTSRSLSTPSRAVGFPEGSRAPRPLRIVVRSAAHFGSCGMGSLTATNPQAVRTPWLPPVMWQLWQVGAEALSGRTPSCLRELRTPCLDEEYISHWGWSIPMWQVWQAWGCRASFLEKRCRVWQESQEATPNWPPCFLSSLISTSVLIPILWQPPQPFMPSMRAMGCMWKVGMAFREAHALACLPSLNCLTWVPWQ